MTDGLAIHTGSDNVFHDLGFPETEAQNLLLRADLVVHIRKVIDKLGVTQAEAAKRAGITQPAHERTTATSCPTRWALPAVRRR